MYFQNFWKKHPALLYGLGMLAGISLVFKPYAWSLYVVAILLLIAAQSRLLLLLLFTCFSIAHTHFYIQLPQIENQKIPGQALFKIASLSESSTHFGRNYLYKGTLVSFSSLPQLKNLPITIMVPIKAGIVRPLADQDYFIEGVLSQKKNGRYIFKLDKQKSWSSIKNSWSPAEIRYSIKNKAITYIKTAISDPESGTFLAGIATGCFDDRHMSADFSRFGLQHIMAISGFHFSIIASFLIMLFGCICKRNHAITGTIVLLTCYFIFLGCSASIIRSWIAILIALGGALIHREGSALNSLGMGLIAVLAYDPSLYSNLGFQFSFLATASILLFYSEIDVSMQKVFKKRSLSIVKKMNKLNQCGYLILTTLRQALSLTLAVNLTAFPLTLFYFESYPILSMVYNIFFPFLVSISMLLLILGLALPIFPFIHDLNSTYTRFLLGFTENLPRELDLKIELSVTFSFLVIYLSLFFFISIYYLEKKKNRLEFICNHNF